MKPGRTADLGRPAPRPAYSVLGTERGRRRRALPDWRDGLAEYLAAAVPSRMKLLVCGGAGFIGSTFVRLRVREHGDEVTVLDKLTYAGRRENLHDVIDRHPVRARRDRGPGGGGARRRRAPRRW